MDNLAVNKIKKKLEDSYDIPFAVNAGMKYNDAWADIKPHNSEENLFEINIKFKNQLRLVIEVTPEKYAAFSINDMANATYEKKRIFTEYAKQLRIRRANIEFMVNDSVYNPEEPDTWPLSWYNYYLRVSRSPIISEDEKFDWVEIAGSWAGIVTGMFLSLLNIIRINESGYLEGGIKRIEINKYERNPMNRELCLIANGYQCKICGFSFGKIYGEIGYHFIHVHHIVPVSKIDGTYIIDPVTDMIPVCPNCHAMLHHSDPPLSPEVLKKVIQFNKEFERDY